MRIISHDEISNYHEEACKIMKDIGSDDILFIAAALAFNAIIWSDDKHFKKQNRIKILSTEEMRIIDNNC
jgi:predicted nucleic acid-binding protein